MVTLNTHRTVLLLIGLILGTSGCGGGGGSSTPPAPVCVPTSGQVSQTKNVSINWTANNEVKVNTTGGGYRVYVSATSGFNIGDAGVTMIDVPYVSGATAPTTTTVIRASGLSYVKVLAYSVFPAGQNNTSTPSEQISVCVPYL